jgi:OOP family OmpA-OmpF porin
MNAKPISALVKPSFVQVSKGFSKVRVAKGLTALALSAIGFSALADSPFVGVNIGYGRLDVDCTGAPNCSKGNTAGKMFGGYQWSNGWGLELGIQRFASADAHDATASVDFTADALSLAALYRLELSQDWWGGARLGFARVDLKRDYSDTTGQLSLSDTSTQPVIGLDLGYRLNKQLSLTASADFSRAKAEGETRNMNFWAVGMKYEF